jgi:hypothetical protein
MGSVAGPHLLRFVEFVKSDWEGGRAPVEGMVVVRDRQWRNRGCAGGGTQRRGCCHRVGRRISTDGGGGTKYRVRVRDWTLLSRPATD